jgi:hypothetical protein
MIRQAICEYWDSRGAIDLFDNMNQRPFEGGTWDMKYIWDEPPTGQWVFFLHTKNMRADGLVRKNQLRINDEKDLRVEGGEYRNNPAEGEEEGTRGRGIEVRLLSIDGADVIEPYPAPPRDRYSDHPPAPPIDDRLDQARKVQQVCPLVKNMEELMVVIGKSRDCRTTPGSTW